jgi:hypothetical protein
MSKSIKLSEKQWLKIYNHIAATHPPSVLLIREKMKSVLGFTSRRHEEFIDHEVDIGSDINYKTRWQLTSIHLDFYNESKRTMFLLKYSEELHGNAD